MAIFLKNAEEKINSMSGNTNGVIDLTFGFNPQKTLDMVAAYTPEARAFYATTEMTTDVIYPIVYALFFGIVLTLLFRNKSYSPPKIVNVLPTISLLFDYLENYCIVTLLKSYPSQSQVIAMLCELVKMLKWISFGIVIAFIVYGIVRLVWGKFNSQKN